MRKIQQKFRSMSSVPFSQLSAPIFRFDHHTKRKEVDKGTKRSERCLCVWGKRNVLILSKGCHSMCVPLFRLCYCWHKYHINFHANPQKRRRTFTNLTFWFFFHFVFAFVRSYVHAVVHIFIKIITVFRFLFYSIMDIFMQFI